MVGRGPAINSVRKMTSGGQGAPAVQPCLLLLFPIGERPSTPAIRTALARGRAGHISYDPAKKKSRTTQPDWLEVVVDGLTFDLLGLAPGPGLPHHEPRHCFGIAAETLASCEAIGLAPGPHLAGAANAMPVVRTLLRLASALAAHCDEVLGAMWLPAQSAMQRDIFVEAIDGWLGGGAFPALGLTAVADRGGGVLASDGLTFFTGQELVLEPTFSASRLEATRLLVALIDRLVEALPLTAEHLIRLESRGFVRLTPVGSDVAVALA